MSNDKFTRIERVFDPEKLPPGAALEQFIYAYLEHEMRTHRLPFIRELCRLYRGKRYWSDARHDYIPCDISIEVYMDKESDDWSLLWIWECKDWSRPVSMEIGVTPCIVNKMIGLYMVFL